MDRRVGRRAWRGRRGRRRCRCRRAGPRSSSRSHDERVQARGEVRAAAVDAHERDGPAGVLLDDLVRDAHERAADVVLVEDDPRCGHIGSFLASRDRVKGTPEASSGRRRLVSCREGPPRPARRRRRSPGTRPGSARSSSAATRATTGSSAAAPARRRWPRSSGCDEEAAAGRARARRPVDARPHRRRAALPARAELHPRRKPACWSIRRLGRAGHRPRRSATAMARRDFDYYVIKPWRSPTSSSTARSASSSTSGRARTRRARPQIASSGARGPRACTSCTTLLERNGVPHVFLDAETRARRGAPRHAGRTTAAGAASSCCTTAARSSIPPTSELARAYGVPTDAARPARLRRRS